jgi:hypothetical protein
MRPVRLVQGQGCGVGMLGMPAVAPEGMLLSLRALSTETGPASGHSASDAPQCQGSEGRDSNDRREFPTAARSSKVPPSAGWP